MATVAFCSEMYAVGRVLWESTHEPLQCLPHTWRSALGRVRGVGDIRCRVCTTASKVQRILRTSRIWQSDDVAGVGIEVSWDRVGVAEADLGWVVDEEHVRHVAEN